MGLGWIGMGRKFAFRQGGDSWSTYWLTRTPTLLTLSNVGYPEGIKLDWTNAGVADYDGTSIERSADGITYAEIDTVAVGVVTYTDATAVFQTEYYYRVRAYKGTNYSPYSNVESLEVTSDRFIITVDTTKAGSANDTFVLPTNGAGYDAYVDWGEGGAEQNITGTPGNVTHVYASPGTYQIRIRGTFPAIYFNNTGDKLKLMYVDNWGVNIFASFSSAFYGCANFNGRWKDIPQIVNDCNFTRVFYDAAVFNYPLNFDFSSSRYLSQMLRGCTQFNQVLNLNIPKAIQLDSFASGCAYLNMPITLNSIKAQALQYAFNPCISLKQSLANIDIRSATNLTFLLNHDINATGTTTNYDATLISWASQAITHSKTALTTSFGTSKYGEGLVDSGTTDGVSAGKLIQSGQNFMTTVTVGDVVYNTTDGTYAFVTAIDSDTQLSISVDIMASGENYRIQHSDAAKARAQLVIPVVDGGQGWTITDGGYA